MIGTIYTSIPCGTGTSSLNLDDGVYAVINGVLTDLGTPPPGDYFVDYSSRILRPAVPASAPSNCPPLSKGVYISDGAQLSKMKPGTYEVTTDSFLPYVATCPPPVSAPTHPNGDLLLAALIGGFVGNSLEKNLSGSAEDIEEEEYQL